jgi:hypothetical protein
VRITVGAQNLFWIEGPGNSSSFAGMVGQHALLKVSGVVYASNAERQPGQGAGALLMAWFNQHNG